MNDIPSWAVRGAKVIALGGIGGKKRLPPAYVIHPEVGKVYTIRDVVCDRGEVGIYLAEIVNCPLPSGFEPGWLIRNFRPIVTRSQEQDMAIFRPILDHVREDA